jgi:flagellar P-ring protein FlgI
MFSHRLNKFQSRRLLSVLIRGSARGVLLVGCVVVLLIQDVKFAQGQTRLSDLVEIQYAHRKELIGYGLVTGLDRSGDRTTGTRGAVFTVQSIANMLENFGITVDAERLRTRNVAAVMVTATLTPFHAEGSSIDVTVSSLGDASSLQGGVLLQTPLFDPDSDEVVVKAQGALIVGGIMTEVDGARVASNPTLTASAPKAGLVLRNSVHMHNTDLPLGLVLREPNLTNARRIADVINETFDEELAHVSHAGLVLVSWPQVFQNMETQNVFVSIIMEQEIRVDTPARVVINERTGTIVAGGNIRIDEVMVSHGNVQVRTQVTPFVVQPNPFGGGETVVGEIPRVEISEESAQTVVFDSNTNVHQLAATLSTLGLTPRDIISIFQAIDRAGALRGQLIVM